MIQSFIEQSLSCAVLLEKDISVSLALKEHIGWHVVCQVLLLHLSHELRPGNALCNSFSGGQFFALIASFGAVMEPPAEIVTFHHSWVSNVHTRGPPGELCTVDQTKSHTDILKCEQGAGCAWLFNLLKMIPSEWTCLWMFRFQWRTVVQAEPDVLQAPCFCCK